LGVSAIGGAITATSVGTWYQELEKPPFNPPDWVFAPVWPTLYIMMGIAGWRVWRRRGVRVRQKALVLFVAQLSLNLAWSFLFFGLQRVDLALIDIVILLLAIAANAIFFWRIDQVAGLFFAPYVLWIAYATVLNASLWLLNLA
jgi:tryptophan-rich sensory protein